MKPDQSPPAREASRAELAWRPLALHQSYLLSRRV
jgi:hypothetical protein